MTKDGLAVKGREVRQADRRALHNSVSCRPIRWLRQYRVSKRVSRQRSELSPPPPKKLDLTTVSSLYKNTTIVSRNCAPIWLAQYQVPWTGTPSNSGPFAD